MKTKTLGLILGSTLLLSAAGAAFFVQLKGQAYSKVHQYRKKHLKLTVTESTDGQKRLEVCNLDKVPLLELKVRFKPELDFNQKIPPLAPSVCADYPLAESTSGPASLDAWAALWEGETEGFRDQWVSLQ
jgi:hypothetical protein